MRKLVFTYAKTKVQISCSVIVQLIIAFAFVIEIVQLFYLLNPKFQAPGHTARFASDLIGHLKDRFSHDMAHMKIFKTFLSILSSGTHGVHDLVFELTGIDLETTAKEDLQKDMLDMAVSPIDFSPKVQDRAISVIRFTPEEPPPGPTPSPEIQEHISPEHISPEHMSPDLTQV